MKSFRLSFLLPFITIGLLGATATASAFGRVVERANCPDGSDLTLIADGEDDNERVELELHLDDAIEGDRYRMVLKRNGRRLIRRVRTIDNDEEAALKFTIRNRPGTERILGLIRNLRTGQSCRVHLRFRR